MKIAIYPGTFDPITYGHLDVIERAAEIFEKVIVTIARNGAKEPLFTEDERVAMVRDAVKKFKNVSVDCFDGLLVAYARKRKATAIVRGLRAVSDFEYEFQMALMNRRQRRKIETVFLMSGFKWFYTSSRLIKEVVSLGGSVKGLVPDNVNQKLIEKFNTKNGKE